MPAANVADTLVAAERLRSHAPVPMHAPSQPVNTDPGSAAAVSENAVADAKVPVHVAPQSMPAAAPVTLPEPLPAFVTVSIRLPVGIAAAAFATSSTP